MGPVAHPEVVLNLRGAIPRSVYCNRTPANLATLPGLGARSTPAPRAPAPGAAGARGRALPAPQPGRPRVQGSGARLYGQFLGGVACLTLLVYDTHSSKVTKLCSKV